MTRPRWGTKYLTGGRKFSRKGRSIRAALLKLPEPGNSMKLGNGLSAPRRVVSCRRWREEKYSRTRNGAPCDSQIREDSKNKHSTYSEA